MEDLKEESVRGGRGSTKQEVCKELKPYIYCIFCSFCYAGYNIVSKVYLDKGMSRYVLVAYGHAFGTLATAFLAFLFERYPLSFLLFVFRSHLILFQFISSTIYDPKRMEKNKEKLFPQVLSLHNGITMFRWETEHEHTFGHNEWELKQTCPEMKSLFYGISFVATPQLAPYKFFSKEMSHKIGSITVTSKTAKT